MVFSYQPDREDFVLFYDVCLHHDRIMQLLIFSIGVTMLHFHHVDIKMQLPKQLLFLQPSFNTICTFDEYIIESRKAVATPAIFYSHWQLEILKAVM